jgi:hypothetical protein
MLRPENAALLLDREAPKAGLRRIAVIGNYLPRQCGIATFTTDLCEAIGTGFKEIDCFALPMNDVAANYDYPERVRFELAENDLATYQRAAIF